MTYGNPTSFTNLYKSTVRSHLDYCSTVSDTRCNKGKFLLERVQRRFTGLFSDLKATCNYGPWKKDAVGPLLLSILYMYNFIHHHTVMANNEKNRQIEIINIWATLTTSVQKNRYCTTYFFEQNITYFFSIILGRSKLNCI